MINKVTTVKLTDSNKSQLNKIVAIYVPPNQDNSLPTKIEHRRYVVVAYSSLLKQPKMLLLSKMILNYSVSSEAVRLDTYSTVDKQ